MVSTTTRDCKGLSLFFPAASSALYGPSPSLAEAHLKFLEATEKLSQSMGLSQEMVATLSAGRTRLTEEVQIYLNNSNH